MQPEDILLLGVAGVVALNRGFSGTGLRDSNGAYVIIQTINIAACVGMFVFRLDGYPAQLDFWVRTFLTLFVGWQMVNNNRIRVALRRGRHEQARRDRERQKTLDAIHDQNRGLGLPEGTGPED